MENDAPVTAQKVLTVTEMILDLQAYAKKVHKKKPKLAGLMMNAAYALKQMVDRLHKYEHPQSIM